MSVECDSTTCPVSLLNLHICYCYNYWFSVIFFFLMLFIFSLFISLCLLMENNLSFELFLQYLAVMIVEKEYSAMKE